MPTLIRVVCLSLLCLAGCDSPETPQSAKNTDTSQKVADVKAERSFKFNYDAKILGVPSGATVKVWMPVAQSSPQQTVKMTDKTVPDNFEINQGAGYGNKIGFFEVKQQAADQAIGFSLQYEVDRKQAGLDDSEKTLAEDEAEQFLKANRLVPKIGKPLELLDGQSFLEDPKAQGEVLYKIVEDHMKYDKSKPGYGHGDSVWACDSKTGNCTDFHSLFISLARSRDIPARFQIGFSIPTDRPAGTIGGYHCWAWFHVDGQGWLPVDISEADKHPEMKKFFCGNLTADRVTFSTGRDIKLVPASKTESLNYFVYPHVEVDGQQWPKDKIKLDFTYEDVSGKNMPAKAPAKIEKKAQ